jgi:hypothetical protein
VGALEKGMPDMVSVGPKIGRVKMSGGHAADTTSVVEPPDLDDHGT